MLPCRFLKNIIFKDIERRLYTDKFHSVELRVAATNSFTGNAYITEISNNFILYLFFSSDNDLKLFCYITFHILTDVQGLRQVEGAAH